MNKTFNKIYILTILLKLIDIHISTIIPIPAITITIDNTKYNGTSGLFGKAVVHVSDTELLISAPLYKSSNIQRAYGGIFKCSLPSNLGGSNHCTLRLSKLEKYYDEKFDWFMMHGSEMLRLDGSLFMSCAPNSGLIVHYTLEDGNYNYKLPLCYLFDSDIQIMRNVSIGFNARNYGSILKIQKDKNCVFIGGVMDPIEGFFTYCFDSLGNLVNLSQNYDIRTYCGNDAIFNSHQTSLYEITLTHPNNLSHYNSIRTYYEDNFNDDIFLQFDHKEFLQKPGYRMLEFKHAAGSATNTYKLLSSPFYDFGKGKIASIKKLISYNEVKEIKGKSMEGYFGYSMCFIGNFDSNHGDDLAVLEPYGGAENKGALHIIKLFENGLDDTIHSSISMLNIGNGLFGHIFTIHGGTDINNDGITDVLLASSDENILIGLLISYEVKTLMLSLDQTQNLILDSENECFGFKHYYCQTLSYRYFIDDKNDETSVENYAPFNVSYSVSNKGGSENLLMFYHDGNIVSAYSHFIEIKNLVYGSKYEIPIQVLVYKPIEIDFLRNLKFTVISENQMYQRLGEYNERVVHSESTTVVALTVVGLKKCDYELNCNINLQFGAYTLTNFHNSEKNVIIGKNNLMVQSFEILNHGTTSYDTHLAIDLPIWFKLLKCEIRNGFHQIKLLSNNILDDRVYILNKILGPIDSTETIICFYYANMVDVEEYSDSDYINLEIYSNDDVNSTHTIAKDIVYDREVTYILRTIAENERINIPTGDESSVPASYNLLFINYGPAYCEKLEIRIHREIETENKFIQIKKITNCVEITFEKCEVECEGFEECLTVCRIVVCKLDKIEKTQNITIIVQMLTKPTANSESGGDSEIDILHKFTLDCGYSVINDLEDYDYYFKLVFFNNGKETKTWVIVGAVLASLVCAAGLVLLLKFTGVFKKLSYSRPNPT